MIHSPLAIKRRRILGDIYERCDPIESIPVYFKDKTEEPVGSMDESVEHFEDTFLFHLPEIFCKKLSAGHFEYIFEYKYTKKSKSSEKKRRILLTGIFLLPKVQAKAG